MIAPGSRLGPYEIAAPLGAGGMGEVYRARDSRLDRTVAIKVLPRHLSSNEQLRERFEREARAISALSHPNICTLYDVGQHDGIDYLVMEYLDGESLADRLAKGPLPIDQVIRYGVEIAEALDKAHRAGIVHRDLKPGNIILTKSGAKLLDFGLAKFAARSAQSDPNALTAALPQDKPLTEEGTILGTFQYMAPEQIEGRDADARTDIFALGVLLYEMATGKRAFDAKTKASLIASILDRDPPPISTVQPLTPRALERVVQLCLAKDPDERWQSAHDVAAELRWIRDTSSETIGPGARRSRTRKIAQASALVLAGLLVGAAVAWLMKRDTAPPRPVSRFAITTPPNAPMLMGRGSLAVSPDGTRVVYRALVANTPQLYLRVVGNPTPTPISGTDHGYSPQFSPDGKWIAFMDRAALKKVAVEGGTPVRLAPADESGSGVQWAGDTIYYVPGFIAGIWSVNANGGTPRQIVKLDVAKGYRALLWPHLLPDTQTMLVTAWTGGTMEESKIVAYSLRDGTSRVIVEGGSGGRYSLTGHLLYARGSNLMAVPFDPKSLKTSGAPVTVVGNVTFDSVNGEPQFVLAANGDMLFVPGGTIDNNTTLVSVDRGGKVTPVVSTQRPYFNPATSRDGRTIALILATVTYDVWLLDVHRDVLTRVSFGGDDLQIVMSPDGRHIYWSSGRGGAYELYRAPTDGSGGEERLAPSTQDRFMGAVSPDNRFLLFAEWKHGKSDIGILPLDTRIARPYLATPHNEYAFSISHDGRWLLYRSDESGKNELYVRPVEGSGAKTQISVGGGTAGGFTTDGKEILYRWRSKFFSVPIESTAPFRVGKPQLLLDDDSYEDRWTFIADDKRLLLVKKGPQPTSDRIEIVLNWAEELKRRVPAR